MNIRQALLIAACCGAIGSAAQAQTGGIQRMQPGAGSAGASSGMQSDAPAGGNMPPMSPPRSPNDAEHAPTRSMSTAPGQSGVSGASQAGRPSAGASMGMSPDGMSGNTMGADRGRGIWHGSHGGEQAAYPR